MMNTRRMMWMGVRGREQWVPASKVGDFSRIGDRTKDTYLNGGAGIRGTKDGHKEYNLSWSSIDPRALRDLRDMAEGLHDTGIGNDLIYFIDPTTYEQNVLASMYAAPYKTGLDGVPLTLDADGYFLYPSLVQTPSTDLKYPARSARYTLTQATRATSIYVPIPEGKVLWFGAHGSENGACVTITPVKGDARGTSVLVDMLDVTDRTICNTSVAASDTVTGVEISLAYRDSTETNTVTVDLAGMIAQILDPGRAPFNGEFISGQGNSGCQFDSIPTDSPYLGGRKTGASARLVEVGSWQ